MSGKMQLREFLYAIRSWVLDVFKHSLLIDATDQSKIGSDQDRITDYTPFHFSQTLPLDESTPVYLFLLSAAAAASLIA